MKIGVDASRLRPGMTGIGRYTLHLLDALCKEMPEDEFVVFSRADEVVLGPAFHGRVVRDSRPISRRMPLAWWLRYRLGPRVSAEKVDVLWAANTLLPARLGGVPCVSTVYDLNHVLYPQTMPRLTRQAHRSWFARDVLAATRVAAISQGTSERLRGWIGRGGDAVVRPGLGLQDTALPEASRQVEILRGLGLSSPFLMTVGTVEPRKNLGAAVQAVRALKEQGHLRDHRLLVVGARGWGRHAGPIAAGTEPSWLRPVGYVGDETLAALYARAEALLFPSLYEGFGIPIAEAVAAGCRVVASDTPEMREAGEGGSVVYAEPDAERFAAAILDALSAPRPLRPGTCARGNWAHSAKVMAQLLRDARRAGQLDTGHARPAGARE